MRNSLLILLLPLILLQYGCSQAASGPCDALVYHDGGLSRSQYVPCAREIVATLDQAERELDGYYNGNDQDGRRRARSALNQAWALLKKAGGYQKMLARWADTRLNSLNLELWNAYFQYDAAILAPGNDSEFNNGRHSHDSARKILSSLQ